ncbi:hypothetical protein J3E72DRAFT_374176 [Bipolaris maydis]|uniref:uncharacterized protein n=1 Tax=Cochliobolus heterostrophus TaxID=5016 RepID=UPI0024D89950|nr:hypothetical protein J3E73DRAFT_374606 [Bipolaris maydis]KAJ5061031.1 hypothetical protein J3E74DRAFT_289879 [Bipolaris maydis]KAJ6198161.1 hypothetical protein J3E72DRAFT_374176 [Bipolaris maydis]KAJ6272166.1 hypothetical protein PSV08DRAFT_370224 [Bipolaris maydis]KAJ6281741.1 hypothetical protein J3E71DRAFT_240722 [Bipolaris maydis]
MRATLLAALLATTVPVVVARWNQKLCNGAGGCIHAGYGTNDPFLCPDGSTLSTYEFANDQYNAGLGNNVPAGKEEFPETCMDGNVPPSAGVELVKSQSRNNQTMYFYLRNTRDNTNPEKFNCYSRDPNPSIYTVCAMYDPSGKRCKINFLPRPPIGELTFTHIRRKP